MSNTKVTIGWIDSGNVTSGFAAYMSQLMLHRSDIISGVVVGSGPYLSANRNTMVRSFLENTDSEWLLSLDSDLLIDLNSFDNLINALDVDKYQILSGVYYLPMNDSIHIAAMIHEEGLDYPVWIDSNKELITQPIVENLVSVGGGYMAIHRTVFEKILEDAAGPMPWFQDYWEDYPYDQWITDDVHFFKQVKKYNFNVALCMSATSTHLKTSKLDGDVYLSYLNMSKYQESKNGHEHQYPKLQKSRSWWVKGKGLKS